LNYFVSDGLKLACTMEGKGTPIMLVHGFGSTHRANWIETGWTRALIDAGFRVIMADGRGHGASDKPHDPADYALEAMAEDVIALLDHIGEPGVDIMGYSMGAMVTLVALALHPERFDRAIAAGVGENLLLAPRGADAVVAAMQAGRAEDIADPEARLYRLFADQNGQDRVALAACFQTLRQPYPVELLGKITRPVLVVAGENDPVGAPSALAARIPGATSHVVPKRDHMRTVGDKDYKAAVLKFLETY